MLLFDCSVFSGICIVNCYICEENNDKNVEQSFQILVLIFVNMPDTSDGELDVSIKQSRSQHSG